jgi:hypothetical protein
MAGLMSPADKCFRIERDDGQSDQLAGRLFPSYDEAHAELERYYADLCCSDEREYYRIVEQAD